jgi:hypothetical protein
MPYGSWTVLGILRNFKSTAVSLECHVMFHSFWEGIVSFQRITLCQTPFTEFPSLKWLICIHDYLQGRVSDSLACFTLVHISSNILQT